MGFDVVLLVHDEILIECNPEDTEYVLDIMSLVMLCVADAFCTGVTWKVEGLITDRWVQKTQEEDEELSEVAMSTIDWRPRPEFIEGQDYGLSENGFEFQEKLIVNLINKLPDYNFNEYFKEIANEN